MKQADSLGRINLNNYQQTVGVPANSSHLTLYNLVKGSHPKRLFEVTREQMFEPAGNINDSCRGSSQTINAMEANKYVSSTVLALRLPGLISRLKKYLCRRKAIDIHSHMATVFFKK